jgi:2,4-dienoyl-CoA reductase-like NADH-dependent reductase (Old Yellow Enzyme family)/thioredoxin reductase
MHPKYPHIFSPIRLGPVELPNRFFFSPHGVPLTIGSKPSNDLIAYATERVKDGGCGLVVQSLTVHERGRHFQPSPYLEENVPSFLALADAVHEAGGKIFGEVWYHWCSAGQWELFSPTAPALGPSISQYGLGERTMSTHEMTREEIRGMVEVVRQSTAHLRRAGFDGVLIHASHAGLVEQFLSPYYNRRIDEYGGSLENRMRVLKQCLQAAREAAGGDMAVGMRFNADELVEGGYSTSESGEVLKILCDEGLLDVVDIDVAMEPQQLRLGMPNVFIERQVYRPFVEAIRKAAGKVPVMSVLGRVTSIADAEAAIAAGACDVAGSARALIAEPELVKNARQGKEELSRSCISCNWCLAALSEGAQGCTINPASFHERNWGVDTFRPAPRSSKVVVVGAGPGGLEAARVAARKGHAVTLFEAREKLGGALALWASLPGREDFADAIDWWERELARLGVTIRRATKASAEAVLAEAPDAVIVATGALHSRTGRSHFLDLEIPGWDQDFVHTPEDILLKGLRFSGKVVLLDGEGLHASAGTAEVLAAAGAQVEYLTPGFSPISGRLVDAQEGYDVVKRMRTSGVSFSPSTYIRRIGDRDVTVYDVHTDQHRIVDDVEAVVLATGREPVDQLAKALEGKVAQLYSVGDALAARVFAAATFEGQKFARYIGEPGAPSTVGEAFYGRNAPEFTPMPAELARAATTASAAAAPIA